MNTWFDEDHRDVMQRESNTDLWVEYIVLVVLLVLVFV